MPIKKPKPEPIPTDVDGTPIDVTKHEGRLYSIIKPYLNYGIPQEDLMQAGLMGMLKAVPRYKKKMGFKFLTYGRWYAAKEVKKLVKLHLRFHQTHTSIESLIAQLQLESPDKVETVDSPTNLLDHKDDPAEALLITEKHAELKKHLNVLTRRELGLVYASFWEGKTNWEIAEEMGMKRKAVINSIGRSVAKLRASIQAEKEAKQ